jgi:3-oxoadipate enol-lactonase
VGRVAVRLDYRLHGRGGAPPLVLANSLGTRQQLWSRQLPELTERFRVLTYDHPGHGASMLPDEPCTVEGFARGLLGLLDDLALEHVSICGTSLGGMVAMALALEAPERVERLVLTCTSAYLGPPEGWRERAQTVRSEGMGAIADGVVVRWFTSALAREQPETVACFRAMLVGTPSEGYACCCDALAVWDARERIAEISAPTLVVAGAQDPATPLEHARFLESRIPDARMLVLENAAHLANVERAMEFTNAVLDHLGEEVPV